MISLAWYIIFIFMILLTLVFWILGAYYQRQFEQCFNYKSPWCYVDWFCRIPENAPQATINAMISAGVIPPGTQVGDDYNVTAGIFKQLLEKCHTTTDSSKLKFVNSITGQPCLEGSSPDCKVVPIGCTTTLYGGALNQAIVWGQSGGPT